MIRAYVPWYLVRNYWAFAFIACLGALLWAAARRSNPHFRLIGQSIALALVAGAFLVFYALAPELLTPGPAGGEMTFLFGLAAIVATGVWNLAHWIAGRLGQPGNPGPETTGAMIEGVGPNSKQAWRPSKSVLLFLSLSIVILDLPLFRLLNGLAQRTPLIDVPVQFLMNDYIVPTALVLALLAIWFAGRDANERAALQTTVLKALVALALASITLKLINQVYFRPRPFAFDDSVRLLFYHPSDSSFPSNAATICFSLATAVWLEQPRWGRWMLLLAAGMVLARVIGGVHYPADVVAGAWLGAGWAWVADRAGWLQRPLAAVGRRASRIAGSG